MMLHSLYEVIIIITDGGKMFVDKDYGVIVGLDNNSISICIAI